MKLKSISCSSKGNSFILEHNGSSLLLDAGVSYKEIVRACNYAPGNLWAALVTHEHQDHAKAANDLSDAGVPIIMSQGTANVLSQGRKTYAYSRLASHQRIAQPPWMIMGFEVVHDAEEPLGFLISNTNEPNVICYMPDNGYSRFSPVGITDLIIECNYVDEKLKHLIDSGNPHGSALYNRIKHNHMSLSRCVKQIELMDRTKMNKIILTHLSEDNSDEQLMISTIQDKFRVETIAAKDGMEIDLAMCPF